MSYNEMMKNADEAYAPIPSGPYFAEIKTARHKLSANQKKMFEVAFSILAGPHVGRQVWRNFVISAENPAAMARFFNDMTTMGADRNFFKAEPTDDQVCQKILGARVAIEVNQREWNGSIRNDISKVSVLPAGLELPTAAAVPSATPTFTSPAPVPQPAAVLTTPAPLAPAGQKALEATRAELAAALQKHNVPAPAPAPIPADDTDEPF